VTCHIGSLSTCHPTQVNTPHLNSSQTDHYSIYLTQMDRPRWLVTYQDGLPINNPVLTPAKQAIIRSTYPWGIEGCVDLGVWLHIKVALFTCRQTRINSSYTGQYSIYLPQRDRRLSWPRWLVTYRDNLPVSRQSSIQVVSKPGIEQLYLPMC